MSRPFLFLGTRAGEAVAEEEYEAIARFSGLGSARLERIRVEQEPLPPLDLDRFAGIITGGSPFNSSDPREEKSDLQRRVEADLARLLDEVVARDLPFFGACYGIGTLGVHQGAVIDRRYGEPPGAGHIMLTEAGLEDPVCTGIPANFDAFLGHKEAVRTLPPNAVLLATSQPCPVQMFKIKQNLYATQFHPELDAAGFASRMQVYQHHGYFDPADLSRLITEVHAATVDSAHLFLSNFAEIFG